MVSNEVAVTIPKSRRVKVKDLQLSSRHPGQQAQITFRNQDERQPRPTQRLRFGHPGWVDPFGQDLIIEDFMWLDVSDSEG